MLLQSSAVSKTKADMYSNDSRCTILWVDLAIKLLACHLFLEMAYSDDGSQLHYMEQHRYNPTHQQQ